MRARSALSALVPVLAVASAVAGPRPAQASVDPDPVIGGAVLLGFFGGLTTTTAAIVYAAEGRAFDSPWVVASAISSAICGATAVSFAHDGFRYGHGTFTIITSLTFGVLAAIPGYFTVRSALSEAEPGELFPIDPPPVSAALRDPLSEARALPPLPPVSGAFTFRF